MKQTACIFSKGEETGVKYYGARYLDPKYSRWLSGDPALNDYIPKAPIDDESKKHNENLPGMGGVFSVVNLHLYHYAGIGQRSDSELQANNSVKYTDPDGKSEELGSGAGDHLLVRRTDDGKHIIVDGGNQYNYVEQALINYINTGDEKYLNQVPETSYPLAVAGISAFIADYLDNNDTSNSIGSKSETIFVIAMAIAGSSGGNKDKGNAAEFSKPTSRSIKLFPKGLIWLEKGVESVPKSTQQALGVKLTGPVQKPWHLVINGYEIPINPMNPNWKYFR